MCPVDVLSNPLLFLARRLHEVKMMKRQVRNRTFIYRLGGLKKEARLWGGKAGKNGRNVHDFLLTK
jgi:hypothetical protein